MPHVQITWVEGRTLEQKRKIAERVTNVLIEDGKAKRENIHVSFHDVPATNYTERGDCPDVAVRLNAGDQSKSSDVAESAADEENARAAGTPRLVQFRLHRNVDSAGNRREALFAAQLADTVIGIQRAKGNTHPQNHGDQSNQFSAHGLLLLSLLGARRGGRILLGEPLSEEGTRSHHKKFPVFLGSLSKRGRRSRCHSVPGVSRFRGLRGRSRWRDWGSEWGSRREQGYDAQQQ